MKVLIANPPAYIKDHNRHFVQAGSRWSFSMAIAKGSGYTDHYLPYPFFLGYSSALLKRDIEAEVKAIDGCALDFDEKDFVNYVKSYSPDLLVIEVPTVSFPLVLDVLDEIKDTVQCKIAVSGGHVTALAREVMKQYPFIDYCLIGEYEVTLKDLVLNLIEGKEDYGTLRRIKGLAFRYDDKVIINERRELLENLDYLPFPDRDDMPVKLYRNVGYHQIGKPCLQMWSSRGCPFSCIFCLERQVVYASPLYRKRNPIKVVDEMELCKQNYGAKQIYFDDETMVVDRRRVEAICLEILNRRLDIPWTCMGDITIDYNTLKLMAKAGCIGLAFGVETISARTLKKIRKSFVDVERIKHFVDWCKELGIWTHATYIIGLPGDSKEDLMATLKFATKLNTSSAQFSMATPFPGTPFFEMAKENGWLTTLDWTKYDGASFAVVNYPTFKREEIEGLYRYACKLWHVKKQRNLIRHFMMHPLDAIGKARSLGSKKAIKVVRDALSL